MVFLSAIAERVAVPTVIRAVVGLCVLLLGAAPATASDVTLLRLFLADGQALVSYGEFARIGDRVVFSMPVGGTAEQPRLHLVSIPATTVDWQRTERYNSSARYQRYALDRGEGDFAHLSNEVARVLNQIAATTERGKALELATRARRTLAEWPEAHYGYRQREVLEIVGLLDEAIADLRAATGVTTFDLALVANVATVPLEPVLGMPGAREALGGLLKVAALSERAPERLSLLETALVLVEGEPSVGSPKEIDTWRTSIRNQIRVERRLDEKYAALGKELLATATAAAARARIRDVERVLVRIPVEDARLGGQRPEVVQALYASVRAQLDSARHLQLLRDQWVIRRELYRGYQRSVGSQLVQLVKTQAALEAIKQFEGPEPGELRRLHRALAGGAEQLRRLTPPRDLESVHDLLVGAWRFAEQAVRERREAATSGSLDMAQQASSAAAGALLMLAGAQDGLRSFVEPPQLQ